MSSDYLMEMLYQTHVHCTKEPTFTFELPFTKELFNKTKYINLVKDSNNLDEFVNKCYTKYQERFSNNLKGTLDLNPKTWTRFGLVAITNSYKSNSNTVVFPNGCCTQQKCPINQFYQIVLEEICLE